VLGRNKDKDGVHINAVTPDGPAARAGLRDGDVILAIDQHPIAAGDADAALKQARERLANLKENQSVSIEYLRGKEKGVVVVEAARREAWNWPAMINDDPDHPFLPKDFNERVRADVERATRSAERAAMDSEHVRAIAERARNEAVHANNQQVHAAMDQARRAMRRGMPWWGINLAPVDADLGRYFGTDKGALVLSADNDSLPGLRAGDVITAVAGEAVVRPEDVMRSLRDQPAGKDIAIKLMRDRKQLALNVKAPEFKSIFSMPPMPPVPAAPPAPPPPPAAPVAVPAVAATPAAVPAPAVRASDDD
jgi:S1-C subfamily serine protease